MISRDQSNVVRFPRPFFPIAPLPTNIAAEDSPSDARKSEVVITLTAVLNLYGDSAIEGIIDAFALALAENDPAERRHRLAHALLRIITTRVEAQRRRLGGEAGD